MKKIIFFLGLFGNGFLMAQSPAITKAEMKNTVDSLSAQLNRIYVFPEKGKAMSDLLQSNFKEGKYDSFTNAQAFADQLTKDIVGITQDKHLRVSFNPDRIAEYKNRRSEERPNVMAMKEEAGRDNFGFEEVKILPGNIGYIKFNGFNDASIAGDAASAAMNFVAYTDAIIFDIRENGGGSPSMIQLLTSYLYGELEEIHLNNFYFRPKNEITQTWTLPFVPGKRNPEALVYVLTSNYTFSAAEEFTYNLKNLKRAVIVGEVTGGGAHPGGFNPVNDQFMCFIPNGRAINPITNTNWEGTGVLPHVKTDKMNALSTAKMLALDSLQKVAKADNDKRFYQWHLDIAKISSNPFKSDPSKMKNQTGKFGARIISFENNELFYQREGRPKFKMTPMSVDEYYVEGLNIKVKIITKNNKPSAIEVRFDNGESETNELTTK